MSADRGRAARAKPEVAFCLAFGAEELSVSVMRQVLGDTLRGLGVAEDSVYDLLLAATEACTSVLGYGRPSVGAAGVAGGGAGAGYAVVTSLSGAGCRVEVTGPGRVEAAAPRRSLAAGGGQRGLTVARACVDTMTLRRAPGQDTVVILRKHISWSWDAPLRRMAPASTVS